MARIVFAVGSSHGPTIQTPPEDWRRLGEGDTRDPRFDYNELAKRARAGLDQELTIEKQRERSQATHAALGVLAQRLAQAQPDVAVVVSNAHRIRKDDNQTVFSVFRGASLPVAKRSERFDPDSRFRPGAERPKQVIEEKPAEPDLAEHLIAFLNMHEFDVGCTDRLPEGSPLDDAFTFPYDYLFGNRSVAMVPFQLSRYLPYQATPARCYRLGQTLREAIEAWDSDKRVALIASGGLSHQIIDEELDQRVIAALTTSDAQELSSLPRERLNGAPGTPEILNWVTVAGAMAPGTMKLVNYLPCYRSLAGTGHGLTFGYWES